MRIHTGAKMTQVCRTPLVSDIKALEFGTAVDEIHAGANMTQVCRISIVSDIKTHESDTVVHEMYTAPR